jgi:hypothetical protein
MSRKPVAVVVPVVVAVEDDFLSSFAVVENEKAKVPVIHRNSFNQPVIREGAPCVPFRVTFALALASNLAEDKGFSKVPVGLVLQIAKELSLDLRMQKRSALAQVRAQIKALQIGEIETISLPTGKVEVLNLEPEMQDKLAECLCYRPL